MSHGSAKRTIEKIKEFFLCLFRRIYEILISFRESENIYTTPFIYTVLHFVCKCVRVNERSVIFVIIVLSGTYVTIVNLLVDSICIFI